MNKRNQKASLKKDDIAIRLLIPPDLNAKIEVLAAQEMRPKSVMVHRLILEALEHRVKSKG